MANSGWTQNEDGTFQRPFSPSEHAFYPASTSDGAGDMFLHLAFTAPDILLCHSRLILAWGIIRQRHPLLSCKVTTRENSHPYFRVTLSKSSLTVLQEARESVFFRTDCKNKLVSDYLNGPRLLSNENLSYLIISGPKDFGENGNMVDCDLLLCAPHFAGDGMSLHRSIHDFLSLLASSSTDEQLFKILEVSLPKVRIDFN